MTAKCACWAWAVARWVEIDLPCVEVFWSHVEARPRIIEALVVVSAVVVRQWYRMRLVPC